MHQLPAGSAAASHLTFRPSSGAAEIALRVFGKRADKLATASAPLIVYFHGGLFNSGAVEDAENIAQALADSAVVVCVDYPLAASDAMHPYAAPLYSRRLAGLAPTLIITAALDPLRDEAEQYAAKLIAAGVPVQVRRLEAAGGVLLDQRCPRFAMVADTIAQFAADSL